MFQNPFNLTTLNGTNGFAIAGLNTNDNLGYSVSTAGDINGDGKTDLVLGAYLATPGVRTNAGMVYVLLGQASGWPSQFNLTTLNGTNGFAIPGLNANDTLGYSVSTAGDINGDGKSDLVLGAYKASPGERTSAGMVYVLLGQASGWPSQFNLMTLNGTNGFSISGLNTNDCLGKSVSTAGDINGDGKTDLVLGANDASPGGRTNAGTVYVLLGQASGWPSQFNLTTLNGTNGFTIPGINAGDRLGRSVSTAGDINGDGKPDLVLGANLAFPGGRTNAGMAYVLLGQASGWPSQFNLTTLNGTNGFSIPGLNAYDQLGGFFSTSGDINGDGMTDLVLGDGLASSGGQNSAGTVYVLMGRASGWPSQFNLMMLNGTNGFVIAGLNAGDNLGYSVSMVEDINGDGKTDLVLGACSASSGGIVHAGMVYVLLGQASGWPSQFNLMTLNGTNGFAIPGLNAGDNLGSSVSTAGDINGDGKTDLVLGATLASPGGRTNAGTVYVIFGVMTAIPTFSPMTSPAPMFNPTPSPILSSNPMIAPQPAASNITISPERTLSPNPSPNLISQNLTACPLNQPLQWGYHDIVIAAAQALRLSPVDISVTCGNCSQPYLGAYFRITRLQSATLQHRNASGGWNVGELTFFGQDLARGQVALVLQNGSAIAPQLTITATDGVTTLPDQAIQVHFSLIDSSPILLSFHLTIPVEGRVTLTSDNIVLSSSTGKISDLILSVTNIENGYFVQIDALDEPITEFTYYQVQTGQIEIVHTGGNDPISFNMRVSDGLTSSAAQPETVTLFGVPKDPVTQVSVIAGGAVAGSILFFGGLAAFGLYHRNLWLRKKKIKKLKEKVGKELSEKKPVTDE